MKTYGRRRGAGPPRPDAPDDVEIVNLDSLCRLCLAREERDERLVPIFEAGAGATAGGSSSLALRIAACVALEVLEDDGLPSGICRPCHYRLEQYYVFRDKCQSSDARLRSHLRRRRGDAAARADADELGEVTVAIMETDRDGGGRDADDEEGMDGGGGGGVDERDRRFTLPEARDEERTRLACTLKRETEDEGDEGEEDEEEEGEGEEEGEEGEERPLSVRVLSDSGAESGPTRVEVTDEDGSVLLMELTAEEPTPRRNEDGLLLPFECDSCSKAFARMIDLKRHVTVHNAPRGAVCEYCEKWFPSSSAYTRHIRVHTGDKPYACSVCEKRFIQKEILLRHMLIHSAIKPFNCHICKKGFIQREGLRNHMATHEPNKTVRLHRCPLCPKVFCHASGLSRHVGTHTERVYKCLDCEKLFNDKSSLRRHHRLSGHQQT